MRSFTFALVLALATAASPPARAATPPAELLRLVPADPLAVVYVPSVETLEHDVRSLVEVFAPERAEEFSLMEMLPLEMRGLEEIMDPSRPAVVVLRLMPGTPTPMFSMLVPLSDPSITPDAIESRLQVRPLALDDGYAVLGTDTAYAPGDGNPSLLADVSAADLTARVDMAGLFRALGPMLDMFVQMALTQPREGEDGAPPRSLADDEGARAALEVVDMLRDGLATLEVTADVDGERMELGGGIEFLADGPLALGPQGSLDDVWTYTGALEPEAGVYMVSALDLRNLEPLIRGVLGLTSEMSPQGGGLDVPSALWEVQMGSPALMESMSLTPYVGSFHFDAEGPHMRWILPTTDPAALASATVRAWEAAEPVGLRARWAEPRRIADFDVRTAELEVDMETMFETHSDADLDPEGGEAEMIRSMMDLWLSALWVATGPDLAVMAMDDDAAAIGALLERVTGSPAGEAPAELVEARRWAGDDALGVAVVDMGRVFRMLSDALPQSSDDVDFEAMRAAFADAPSAPVHGASRVDGSWLRGRMEMRTESARALWSLFLELNESDL